MDHVIDPIAERVLIVLGQPDRTVTVKIGRPEPAPDMPEVWQCLLQIDGLDAPVATRGCGDASMDALLNALTGARHLLDESGLRWTWPNGEERLEGMPLMPLSMLFPDQIRAIEKYVREQEDEFARRVGDQSSS